MLGNNMIVCLVFDYFSYVSIATVTYTIVLCVMNYFHFVIKHIYFCSSFLGSFQPSLRRKAEDQVTPSISLWWSLEVADKPG
jgi:hypothetical protein